MVTPQQIIESFRSLPEKTTVDEMIERIIVLDQIENAREQSRNGQVNSNKEVKAMVKSWVK
jgi:hypothetical protein